MKKTLDKIKQFYKTSQDRREKYYCCNLHNFLLNAKRVTKNHGSEDNEINLMKLFNNLDKVQKNISLINNSQKLIELTSKANNQLRRYSSVSQYKLQMGTIDIQLKNNLINQLKTGPIDYRLISKITHLKNDPSVEEKIYKYNQQLASSYIDSLLQENRIRYYDHLLSQLLQFASRDNLDNVPLIRSINQMFNGLSAKTRYLTIVSYLRCDIQALFTEEFIKNELNGTKYEFSHLFGNKLNLKNFILKRILQTQRQEPPLYKVLPKLSLSNQIKLKFLLKPQTQINAIKYLNDLICEKILTLAENKDAIPWNPQLLKFVYYLEHEMSPAILTFFLNDFILKNEEFDLKNRKMHIYVLLLLRLVKNHQKKFYQFEAAIEIYKAQTVNYQYQLDYAGLQILIQRNKILEEQPIVNFKDNPVEQLSLIHIEKILKQIQGMNDTQKLLYESLLQQFNEQMERQDFLLCLPSLNILIELGHKEIIKQAIAKSFEINSEEIFYKQLLELLKLQHYSEINKQSSQILGNVLLKLVSDRYLGFSPQEFEQIMLQVLKLEDCEKPLGEHYQENVFVEVQQFYVQNFLQFSTNFNKEMAKHYKQIVIENSKAQIEQIQNKI